MKNTPYYILFLFSITLAWGQVGINTTTPQAALDIRSSNQVTPANNDGILIPKIDAFPSTNPTNSQDGMLVYLTTLSGSNPPGFYYWKNATTTWTPIAGSTTTGWGLTGNAGTNSSTNFIGTTDNQDFIFKRNNIKSGLLGITNTAFGHQTLNFLTTGANNNAFGFNALHTNLSGFNNIAMGNNSLFSNQTGSSNIAIGFDSNYSNISGFENTTIGYNSFRHAFGNLNIALGSHAQYNMGSDVTQSIAIGYYSGVGNYGIGIGAQTQVEPNNIAIGNSSLASGANAIAIGQNTRAYINSTVVGHDALRNNSGALNDAFGTNVLYRNSTGSYNIGIGSSSLYHNETGFSNLGIGNESLYRNTTGLQNIGIGVGTLATNMDGNNNIAIGYNAQNSVGTTINSTTAIGSYTTSGENSVAIGTSALSLSTGCVSLGTETTSSSPGNIAIGYQAKAQGSHVIAIGQQSLVNSNAGQNIGIGYQTLTLNNTGQSNIAIGDIALQNNMSNSNIAIGHEAMLFNTTGFTNIGIGNGTLATNGDGFNNIALGHNAQMASSGANNTITIGTLAGAYTQSIAIGSSTYTQAQNSIAIGNNALAESLNNTAVGRGTNTREIGATAIGYGAMATYENATAIGNNSTTTAANQVRIGDTNITSIGGFADWTNVSDKKFKANIKENVPGLNFISQLRPVTYTLKRKEGKENPEEIHTGFIAQEVEAAAQKISFPFSGIDTPKSNQDYYGLRYAQFVVPLTKAVQEQQEQIETLKKENEALKKRLEKLEQLLTK